MKRILNITLALVMILSCVFLGEISSTSNQLAVQAQTTTGQVMVRRKRKPGII